MSYIQAKQNNERQEKYNRLTTLKTQIETSTANWMSIAATLDSDSISAEKVDLQTLKASFIVNLRAKLGV